MTDCRRTGDHLSGFLFVNRDSARSAIGLIQARRTRQTDDCFLKPTRIKSKQYGFVQELECRQLVESTCSCFTRQCLEQRFGDWRDTVQTLQSCCRSW